MRSAIILIMLAAGCNAAPVADPTAGEALGEVSEAIERGVAYIVRSQNPDGSWGTGTETRGLEVYSMVPGSHDAFRVATTALCVMALREAGEREAHARGVEYLATKGQARRDRGDLLYNIWAHTYALQALAAEMRENDDVRIAEAAKWHLDRLVRYETYMGGWNYYDFDARTQRPSMGPTSFGTAAGVIALWEAKEAGVDVPEGLIERGLRRLQDMRLSNGAYLYSIDLKYYPRHSANLPKGSVGRSQACNEALWLFGRIDELWVRDGLSLFVAEHRHMEMGRKRPYPHDSWYATAPYYYYFGHYYTSRLIERLEEKGPARETLVKGIVPLQEEDGSWWDYAMWDYHKPYGTAFAVMSLLRCQ